MNQKVKIVVAVVAGFAAGFAVARVVTKSNEGEAANEKETDGIQPKRDEKTRENKVAKVESFDDDSFPLKLGSRGEKVERLQIFLMRNLGWVRKPNGIFDLTTKERCHKYFKQDSISQELYQKSMMDKMVHDQRKKKGA